MKILKNGSVFLLLVLFAQTGLSLKCHTCNSLEDKGCTYENFKPTLSTDDYPKCADSLKKTFQQGQDKFLGEDEEFNIDEQLKAMKTSDACIKLTVKEKDSSKKVTIRGCSLFGSRTCEFLQSQLPKGTIVHCHQCQDESMCNHARSTLPLVSAYLMAAIALAIANKF